MIINTTTGTIPVAAYMAIFGSSLSLKSRKFPSESFLLGPVGMAWCFDVITVVATIVGISPCSGCAVEGYVDVVKVSGSPIDCFIHDFDRPGVTVALVTVVRAMSGEIVEDGLPSGNGLPDT